MTGAADGYARMADKAGVHSASSRPGPRQRIANLHNASRAQVPIINIVGQHATYHLPHDTPLTSDIEGIARPDSKWLRTFFVSVEVSKDASGSDRRSAHGTGPDRNSDRPCGCRME